ncbi:hypothetical protein COB55_00165 [Candidatus Wolfebacteria bacterium]|nr:MAG: hypothetical protein COB55_00165 [Candidatus Wolfebacteria bacterium]
MIENLVKKIKCKIVVSKRNLVSNIKTYFLIKKLLKGTNEIKLELGDIRKREATNDWITVDIKTGSDLRVDLSRPLPFPDNSVDMIYSSHLLEHFSYPNPMMDLLNECHRILKPGGVFSSAVPNARNYAEIYLNQKKDLDNFLQHLSGINFDLNIDYLNYMSYMRGEHKHLFDEENLPIILEKSGFNDVKLRKFDPTVDREERAFESIYIQGIKI